VLARDAGAVVLGGCCGTTPEHLKAMADALNSTPPGGRPDTDRLEAELGTAWKDGPTSPVGNSSRQRRRRRSAA
jgi:5-methyltetrahydrofolate--homocysteine methyltransferase